MSEISAVVPLLTSEELSAWAGPLEKYDPIEIMDDELHPVGEKLRRWKEEASAYNLRLPQFFFLSPEAVEVIDRHWSKAIDKWEVALAFRPFVAGLTLGDFMAWEEKARAAAVRSWERFDRSRRNNTRYVLSWGYVSRSYYPENWIAEALRARTPLKSEVRTYRPDQLYYPNERSLISLLTSEFNPGRKVKSTHAWDANTLNEFLNQDDFTGTWKEWIETPTLWSEEAKGRIERYEFKDYGNLGNFLNAVTGKTVITFDHTAQKRHRDFLKAQPHAVWERLILDGCTYNKGKSLIHAQELVKEITAKLSGKKADTIDVLSPEELRRRFTRSVSESVLRENDSYNAVRLNGLARIGLTAIPNDYQLKRFAKEYSLVLYHFDKQLAKALEDPEIKGEDDMGIFLTVGLLLAIVSPRTWLRGDVDNANFLLADLLAGTTNLHVIKLLSHLALAAHPAPTENEWRKALASGDNWGMPLEWFLPLVVSQAALMKNAGRAVGDIVVDARAFFS